MRAISELFQPRHVLCGIAYYGVVQYSIAPKYPNSRPLRALKGSSILYSRSLGGRGVLFFSSVFLFWVALKELSLKYHSRDMILVITRKISTIVYGRFIELYFKGVLMAP